MPLASALPWRHATGDALDLIGIGAMTLFRLLLWFGLTKALFARTPNVRVGAFSVAATGVSVFTEWLIFQEIGPNPAHFNIC